MQVGISGHVKSTFCIFWGLVNEKGEEESRPEYMESYLSKNPRPALKRLG